MMAPHESKMEHTSTAFSANTVGTAWREVFGVLRQLSLQTWASSELWYLLICQYQMSCCEIFQTLRMSLKKFLIHWSNTKRILKCWLGFWVEACSTCLKRKRSRHKEQLCLLPAHLFLIQSVAPLLLETHPKHGVEWKGMTLY